MISHWKNQGWDTWVILGSNFFSKAPDTLENERPGTYINSSNWKLENHLPSTSIFWSFHVDFPGCNCFSCLFVAHTLSTQGIAREVQVLHWNYNDFRRFLYPLHPFLHAIRINKTLQMEGFLNLYRKQSTLNPWIWEVHDRHIELHERCKWSADYSWLHGIERGHPKPWQQTYHWYPSKESSSHHSMEQNLQEGKWTRSLWNSIPFILVG